MPITHIKTTTVAISDEETAIDFYVNKLGFELRRDVALGPMRWIEVAPPGGQTVIVLARGYGHDADRVGTFSGLVLEADDIQATYEQLRDKGVNFSEGPTVQPWGGVQALFADQDGNGYVLVQTQAAPDTSAQPTEAH
jgi:lactoylglutathione lyase